LNETKADLLEKALLSSEAGSFKKVFKNFFFFDESVRARK
jgi:hypothetical protein